MTQYGMIIDLDKCNGCYNCFISCKDEYCGNDHSPYSLSQPQTGQFWMRLIEKERGTFPKIKVAYIPVPCMHCEKANCIELSQDGAVYQRSDGIVIIDPDKSSGKKEILETCPYRVIYWNEEKNIPQKCTMCAHLLDKGWKEPRCVEACPTGAMVFGDLDDPQSEISKLKESAKLEAIHPAFGLEENVLYIGLPKRFIAGTVVLEDKDDVYGENARVTLKGEGFETIASTNNYGDFEFEGVDGDKDYNIIIEIPGYISKTENVQTKTDVYLGEIILSPET
ncbi:4Fe-4S dicluster domain-containing protein [Thermodesulfobacteriota bacterium]